MADPTIRIKVEAAIDGARRNLEKMKGVINDTAKAGEKSGNVLESAWLKWNAATDLALKGVQAVKKVMDFGKEGAIIGQTRESFDRLMLSMGQGPDVLENLREASRYTIDDMTLMSSVLTLVAGASDEVARAMVGASPELLEIAKAANKLNPTLGTTAQMYQSLAVGIKRSSPLILDNLGLTIKIGEANERYAEKLGIAVEEMTAADKQMALLEETLRAGDIMIQQVGGSTAAMGDEFASAEAKMKNATDSIKANVQPAFSDLMTIIADGGPKVADTANQIVSLTEAAMAWVGAAITGKDATEAFNNALGANEAAAAASVQKANEMTVAYGTTESRFLSARGAADSLSGGVNGLTAALADAESGAWGLTNGIQGIPTSWHSQVDHNFGEAAGAADAVGSAVRGIPSHKSVLIEVKTTWSGQAPNIPGYNAPYPERQHGGPVRAGAGYLVGEAGPELFVPQTSGYVVPNNQINHNYNLAIHSSAPAESALSDFHVMRALAGV